MERFDLVKFKYGEHAHTGYIDEDSSNVLKIYDLAQGSVRSFEKSKISGLVVVNATGEQRGAK